ncbi:hypothetical protein RLDS_18695 [Sphingobium lactosutens DS20]|uniref:Uncharacterized protein n=1 Tax=Sphingobium lactosutens DS20 TaxID=1331060 RepID=T0IT17_9SPHN|nr:hypothetical protein RLDS_18695 [Sphingobium lactosutens DS20]
MLALSKLLFKRNYMRHDHVCRTGRNSRKYADRRSGTQVGG